MSLLNNAATQKLGRQKSLIKSWPSPFQNIDVKTFEYMNAWKSNAVQTPSKYESPYVQPATKHYIDHSFDYDRHPGSDPYPRWLKEVAQFPVPHKQVGVVKEVHQYIDSENGPPPGTWTYYTESERWGRPYQTELDTAFWFFFLYPYEGEAPPMVSSTIFFAPPGIPYRHFAYTVNLWFASGTNGTKVHWVIPGGYVLRMFIRTPNAFPDRIGVVGRLRGYVQDIYSENVQQSWGVDSTW